MAKEIPAFLRAEIANNATDPTQEPQNRMLSRLAQMRFEFAEGQLNRVEVRRILRKINQRCARCFDRLRDAGDLAGRWSISTISPRLRVGTRHCFTWQETSARSWLLRAQTVRSCRVAAGRPRR